MEQLFGRRLSKKSSGARWFAKPIDSEGHYDIQLILPSNISDINYSPFRCRVFDDGLNYLFNKGHLVYFEPVTDGKIDSLLHERYREVIV